MQGARNSRNRTRGVIGPEVEVGRSDLRLRAPRSRSPLRRRSWISVPGSRPRELTIERRTRIEVLTLGESGHWYVDFEDPDQSNHAAASQSESSNDGRSTPSRSPSRSISRSPPMPEPPSPCNSPLSRSSSVKYTPGPYPRRYSLEYTPKSPGSPAWSSSSESLNLSFARCYSTEYVFASPCPQENVPMVSPPPSPNRRPCESPRQTPESLPGLFDVGVSSVSSVSSE